MTIYIDVVSTDGLSATFRDFFSVNGKRLIQNNEIKVIHNLLKKILLDDNVVPKVLVMKYLLETFVLKSNRSKNDIKKIYGVYCLALLFTIFDDKKSSSQITDIVKTDDWYTGIITQINRYLNSNLTPRRLAAKYTPLLLEPADNNEAEASGGEWADIADLGALSTYQYRCKSLATIYNYFKIEDNRVSVSAIDELYKYLNDERLFSTEHFILNKSESYCISGMNNEKILYPETITKYVNSLFNFIFIPREQNGSLGNNLIQDKLNSIIKDKITFSCEYTQKVIEICREVFGNKPGIDGIIDVEKIKEKYSDYFSSTFQTDYTNYASKMIDEVVAKIRNR